MVFASGPPARGRYLRGYGSLRLVAKQVDRCSGASAVEAGERLGFCRARERRRLTLYLRPLYDALYDLLEAEKSTNCWKKIH